MADYILNDEAAQIAVNLIDEFHPRLTHIKVAHLLKIMPVPKQKKAMKVQRQGKKITLAKTSKVSPKMAALVSEDYKFVIEYGSLYWNQMDDKTKRALVDHELCHCGCDVDGYYLVNHSVEDFSEIIDRWGFWKKDVQEFADTVESVYHNASAHQEVHSA